MTWKRKTFVHGQPVEVQREANWDHTRGWEPATYREPSALRGWHRVQLPPTAAPITVDVGDRDVTIPSRVLVVPARRIREAPCPSR